MATPPIAPPSAGIPIEALAGGIPVKPEIKVEKIPMGAPAENPVAILGIIEEEQLAGKPAREIHEAVAAADLKPESAAAAPDAAPAVEEPKETPEEEAEAALEAKKREEIKQELRELGKILLDVQDTRASMVSVGLAAGDTPIGNEFREQILTMILQEKKPEAVPEDVWRDKQTKYTVIKAEESRMRKFFAKQGFSMENFDNPGDEATLTHNGLFEKDTSGQLTDKAKNLRTAFGWTDAHPMPTTPEDLATYIGNDVQDVEHMKNICTKTHIEEGKKHFKDTIQLLKDKAPGYMMVSFLAISMVGQLLQEGENPQRGSH